jgi:two-component system, LytTR family, sensor kinase
MRLKLSTYWACQLFGWGLFMLINVFFALAFNKFDQQFIQRLLLFAGLGFSFSHLMRLTLLRINIFNKPLPRQVIAFVLITFVFAFAVGSLESLLTWLIDVRSRQEQISGEWKVVVSNTFASFVYLLMWNCIYFSYYYVQKSRKQQLETLRLEALVKALEQNTIRG